MLVEALGSVDREGQELTVRTEYGEIRGRWCASEPVNIGDRFDVEFEFPSPRLWSELIVGTPASRDQHGLVVGEVLQICDENVVIVRVLGGIVQLETVDTPDRDVVGSEIALSTDDLEFYPTGV